MFVVHQMVGFGSVLYSLNMTYVPNQIFSLVKYSMELDSFPLVEVFIH